MPPLSCVVPSNADDGSGGDAAGVLAVFAGAVCRCRSGRHDTGRQRHASGEQRREDCQAWSHPTMCCKTVTSTGASAASA